MEQGSLAKGHMAVLDASQEASGPETLWCSSSRSARRLPLRRFRIISVHVARMGWCLGEEIDAKGTTSGWGAIGPDVSELLTAAELRRGCDRR